MFNRKKPMLISECFLFLKLETMYIPYWTFFSLQILNELCDTETFLPTFYRLVKYTSKLKFQGAPQVKAAIEQQQLGMMNTHLTLPSEMQKAASHFNKATRKTRRKKPVTPWCQKQFAGLEMVSDLMLNKVFSRSAGNTTLVKGKTFCWGAHWGYRPVRVQVQCDASWRRSRPSKRAPDLLFLLRIPNYTLTFLLVTEQLFSYPSSFVHS